MNDIGYYLYMAEADGLLPTRTGKINAVIREVKAYPSPEIELSEFKKILRKNGLRYEDLTSKEINYINASL